KKEHVENVYVHVFLDGRDVGPKTALTYIEQLERKMKEIGVGKIATISGRYYSMDRDRRWERTKLAYDAIVDGDGERFRDAETVVTTAYEKEIYDEFVVPAVLTNDTGEPVATVTENDALIFYNFRPDRAIQLSQSFTDPNFSHFERTVRDLNN